MNRFPFLAVLTAAVLLTAARSTPGAEPSDEELFAGADARIEKHRKADAVVVVIDRDGKPVPGAKVAVEQTRHAFLFGSNIFQWGELPNDQLQTAYRKHFAELLNFATLPFYWTSYEGEKGKPRHEPTEQVARWCKEHNIITKGHPLAWNMGDPRWLPDNLEEIRRLQMARIDDCVTRLHGLIDRWDVVNEATHFDRPDFAERRAPKHTAMWKKVGQIEFTRECFVHARKAGPQATLLINDYRTDPAYERVIEKLVDAEGKRMYDVIGIQSHMHGSTWNNRKIWDVCQRFARFGVPLHFTETTILSGERGWQRKPPWPSTPEGEAWQAKEAVRIYTMLFSHPSVEALTWWDFCDHYAWQKAPAGFLRKDMTPKPMYEELKKLIKGKWWTKTSVQTDRNGEAKFRGVLGDYELGVTADGKKVTGKFTLVKKTPNRWVVKVE
ncbi:MAG: endo-1,4-beta-xylanase [Candidatus Nealsonbacteria bacterium]|nr:endo-1,4-beta-xylanase [Candidatus Nealsonbacteria bacterium]